MLLEQCSAPVGERFRMLSEFIHPDTDHDAVECEIHDDEENCEADRFGEAFQKDCSENRYQEQRQSNWMMENCRCKRVFYQMRSRVSGGKSNRNDKISCCKSKKT